MTEHVRIANPTPLQQQRRVCDECGRPLADTTDAAGTPYRACEALLGEIEAGKRWNDESLDRQAETDEPEAESPDELPGEGADQDQPGVVVPHAVPSDSLGG
ncbi:MAG TPA: hypothetical protein VNE42_10335 [Acidimicrobiales bacterium]|nr:hypothetical protein [Acidimicrobiales bacterium]